MKKTLVVAVFVTALFAAQNANGQEINSDAVVQTSTLEQPALETIMYAIAEVEQIELSSWLSEGGDCVSYGGAIKLAHRLYERKFTNSCSYSVTIKYKYSNGKKNIQVVKTLAANSTQQLPAGVDGNITDFEE
jgi:methyl coenzyme M reductase alpha subunit